MFDSYHVLAVTVSCTPPSDLKTSPIYENFITFSITLPCSVSKINISKIYKKKIKDFRAYNANFFENLRSISRKRSSPQIPEKGCFWLHSFSLRPSITWSQPINQIVHKISLCSKRNRSYIYLTKFCRFYALLEIWPNCIWILAMLCRNWKNECDQRQLFFALLSEEALSFVKDQLKLW